LYASFFVSSSTIDDEDDFAETGAAVFVDGEGGVRGGVVCELFVVFRGARSGGGGGGGGGGGMNGVVLFSESNCTFTILYIK
jgi:hypothetical protein